MASPIRILGTALRWLAPVLVILLAVAAARGLVAARKAPPKVEVPPRVLPVEIVTVERRDHEATISAFGTTRPLRTLTVRPAVGGPVREVHPKLLEGGRIDAGETLVGIDARDYELAIATAEADVVAARAQLDIELGNVAVAEREWELLEASVEVTDVGRRLALREPYVAQRRAEIAIAESRLDQARLDLERTRLVAPFDLLVLSEDVEIGAQAVTGTELARVVDRSEFVVEVSVPTSRLGLIEFHGAPAQVLQDGGRREGRVARLLGEVDSAGRMARVQVSIPEPLATEHGGPPVLLGAYVRVELPSRPIPNAVSVPRSALREGDVVWTADEDDLLRIVPVEVALRRTEDVLVTEGLVGGERVIVSPVAVPLPGMRLVPRAMPSASPAAAIAGGVALDGEGSGQ